MFCKTTFSFGGNDNNERESNKNVYIPPICVVFAREERNRNFDEMHPFNGRFFVCCQRHMHEPAC